MRDTAVQRVLGKIGIPAPIISFDGNQQPLWRLRAAGPERSGRSQSCGDDVQFAFSNFQQDRDVAVRSGSEQYAVEPDLAEAAKPRTPAIPLCFTTKWPIAGCFRSLLRLRRIWSVWRFRRPTIRLGSYYRWAIATGSGNNFPDYPKAGVWPDAYYFSTREFAGGSTFVGVGAYALDRVQALAGNPNPTMVGFLAPPSPAYVVGDGLLPSDLDGTDTAAGRKPKLFCRLGR